MRVGVGSCAGREYLSGAVECFVDVGAGDAVVGDPADAAAFVEAADADSVELLFELARVPAIDGEVEEVRVGRRRQLHAGHAGEAFGGVLRVFVVFGEAVDHVLECVDAGRGEDARLAHAAAEHLAVAPRFVR